MRLMVLFAFAACAELPPLPELEQPQDWDCEDDFAAEVEACNEAECSGFMSMSSVIDFEEIHFVTESVFSVVKYNETDTVQTIELHGLTDYFRSVINIGSIDMPLDRQDIWYRILPKDVADTQTDAVTMVWEVSNSEIPQTRVGTGGLGNITLADGWIRTSFLVKDETENFVYGCAYMPVD